MPIARALPLLVLGSIGCYRSSSTAPQASVVATLPPPACKVAIEDLHLAEVPTGERGDPAWVVAYPFTAKSVLASYNLHGHYGAPEGDGTLYEVDCATKTAKVFATDEYAMFGHGAMTADGKTLYFSGSPGVRAIDLATKKIRTVTRGESSESCWMREEPTHLRDVVVKLEDNDEILNFERGGPCGFEGDWDTTSYYADHPASPAPFIRRAKPIGVLAVDGNGGVWAGGPPCGGAASLYFSDSLGDRWTKIELAEARTSPIAILPDTKRAGHALIVTSGCAGYGEMDVTEIAATHDRGKTWTRIPLPIETFSVKVALINGSIDAFTLWGKDMQDDQQDTEPGAWRYHPPKDDEDDMWTPLEPAPPEPASNHGPNDYVFEWKVKIGDVTLTSTPDGVLRQRGTEKPQRIYPY